MQHRNLLLAVGLVAALVAVSVASAQAQATNHLWTVAGVVENGAVKTAFSCTNNGKVAADVAVEVFDKTGTSLGSTTLTLGVDESRLWSTTGLTNFAVDSNIGVFGISPGFARILSSARSKVNCSAWLEGSSSMVALTVVKKTKQKGD
jgi:hypothetical protein